MTGTRMSAEQRREQLLDVAKRIVGERGFHAVSIEAVARGAGVSRPIVYGHFGDLHRLLEALVQREGARALRQLVGVLPQPNDLRPPREVLLAALRGYLEAVRDDPVTWRLVLMPQEGAPSVLHEQIAKGRAGVLQLLAELARSRFGSGLRSPDPELTARTLSALGDEAARLVLEDPGTYPVDRVLSHAAWLLEQLR